MDKCENCKHFYECDNTGYYNECNERSENMKDRIHEIVKKGIMPDGTAIQIEDWKQVYPEVEKTIKIAAYPLVKNNGYWVRKGGRFRLELSRGFSSDSEVEYIYNGLISGDIALEDLHEHYWNGDKDRYYMGLEV